MRTEALTTGAGAWQQGLCPEAALGKAKLRRRLLLNKSSDDDGRVAVGS